MRLRTSIAAALLVVCASLAPAAPARGFSTFVVNRTTDVSDINLANAACDTSVAPGNQCTLRAAIEEANDTPGQDSILFLIKSSSTTKVIAPSSPLPPITDAVSINGYSQPGASANSLAVGNDAVLKVVLDGVNAGQDSVGIEIKGNNSVVRGLVIMRFDGAGISVSTGSRNLIRGNFIGTNSAGTLARPNFHGVVLDGFDNTLGGTNPAYRNLISGNVAHGVVICCIESSGNDVVGNYIGTRRNGSELLGNGSDGVQIFNAFANSVGGAASGAGNVISGNGQDGVDIRGANPDGNDANVIQHNVIRGNDQQGVRIEFGPQTVGPGNVIVANGEDGVRVSSTASGARITSNQILANGALGINLSGGKQNSLRVTANDTDDPDAGANGLQNFPVLSAAQRSNATGVTSVIGTLNATPSTQFTIQLFLAAADGSRHGEAQALIASQDVTTNSSGDVGFVFQSTALVAGHVLTATATAVTAGDTSEFSLNRTVVAVP